VEAGDAAEATALFYTASLSGFDYQAFTCRSWILPACAIATPAPIGSI
jgi:hypothetical protein